MTFLLKPVLEPSPVATGWNSTRDMLEEIFNCMKDDSVRAFMLHTEPQLDVEILMSPTLLKKGISGTASTRIVNDLRPELEDSDTISVSLILPTHTSSKYAFALGVSNHDINGNGKKYFGVPEELFHFALCRRSQSVFGFSMNESRQHVTVNYTSTRPSNMKNAVLSFDLPGFISAFGHKTDYGKLKAALKTSFAILPDSSVQLPELLPENTGSVLTGEHFPDVYRPRMMQRSQFCRCIHTDYTNTELTTGVSKLSTLLMSQNSGTYPGTVEALKTWAINFRTYHAVPVVQAPIMLYDEFPHSDSASTVPLKKNKKITRNTCSSVVRIAPAVNKNPKKGCMSYAEILDIQLEERKLRRKIKNRSCAARSNARRSARNRLGGI